MDTITNAPKGLLEFALVLSIIVGIAECFFGYRIFRVLLVILGFFAGVILGMTLAGSISGVTPVLVFIIALVCGIIGGLLMIPLFYVGMFLVGGMLGYLAAAAIAGVAGWQVNPWFFLFPALVMGILAVVLQRLIIILATATSGAWTIIISVYALIKGPAILAKSTDPWAISEAAGSGLFIGWIVLAVIGFIVQYSQGEPEKIEETSAASSE